MNSEAQLIDLTLEEEFETSFNENNAEVCNDNTNTEPHNVKEIAISKAGKSHTILVHPKQKGNPLLKSITNVPWEYENITPDYQMGKTVCALFLSIRYHNLNPDYIHERLKLLGKMYELRILLVLVDVKDFHHPLKHLTRICYLANMVLLLAHSSEEAGKLIETYKIYETKPPDLLKGKSEEDRFRKILETLTSIESINSTDAKILLRRFTTLEGIINATEYQLAKCPGLGENKAKKLYTTLHSNFCKRI